MSRRKADTPSVATFADHEVITPAHELRKAVAAASNEIDDPVARAEAALAELSGEFGSWMDEECTRLEAARQTVKREGFTEKTHDALFRSAHDIKGEAGTFGFPAVAGVADSLCRLIEHTPDMLRIPMDLVDQHVDADARHHSRICTSRPPGYRPPVDKAAARGHGRIPDQGKPIPSGLSGKYPGALAGAGLQTTTRSR